MCLQYIEKKKKAFSDTSEKSYVENKLMEYRVGSFGPHYMGIPGKGRHGWGDDVTGDPSRDKESTL